MPTPGAEQTSVRPAPRRQLPAYAVVAVVVALVVAIASYVFASRPGPKSGSRPVPVAIGPGAASGTTSAAQGARGSGSTAPPGARTNAGGRPSSAPGVPSGLPNPPLPLTWPDTVSVPSSIADDCSRDVSGELAQWMSSQSRVTLELTRGKCYLVSSLVLNGLHDVTLEGNGSTIQRTDPGLDAPTVDFEQGQDVGVRDLTISGGNTGHTYDKSYAFDSAIRLAGVDAGTAFGFAIQNVDIVDSWGDAVTLSPSRHGSGDTGAPTTNVTISGTSISGTGRQGVSFVSCDDVLVAGDALDGVALDTFDVEADLPGEGTTNLAIENTVSGPGHGPWFANAGKGGSQTGNVFLLDNVMNTKDSGVAVLVRAPSGERGPFTIQGNRLVAGASSSTDGIEIVGGHDIFVRSNSIAFDPNSPEAGVGLNDVTNAALDSNTFENAAGATHVGSNVSGLEQSANSCPPRNSC